jgi:hypothetical protein
LTLRNQPTMLLSTVRASAPTAVVSLLTAVRFHPALTPLNHPHFIVALRLSKLLPTRLANPSTPPLRRTNHESPVQNAQLHRVRRASGFVQIPLSQVPRRETLGSTQKFGAGALVDRVLRFIVNGPAFV